MGSKGRKGHSKGRRRGIKGRRGRKGRMGHRKGCPKQTTLRHGYEGEAMKCECPACGEIEFEDGTCSACGCVENQTASWQDLHIRYPGVVDFIKEFGRQDLYAMSKTEIINISFLAGRCYEAERDREALAANLEHAFRNIN